MRIIARLCFIAAGTVASLAQGPPDIDIVDLGGGSFDVSISDLGGGTAWSTAGLAGNTYNGAAITPSTDPNGVIDLNNDFGNLNVTYVSAPVRTATKPFRVQAASLDGKYIGGTGAPTITPNEIDVAWSDLVDDRFYNTGRLARLALDISATGLAAGDIVATKGPAPTGTTLLANGVATATSDTFTDAAAGEITWTVYAIPEPATIALLAVGALAAFRLRR